MRPVFLILAIWAAGLGAAAQFAKLAVGFPALAVAYPGAGAALGFAVSLLSLLGLFLGLSAGRMVARTGPRRALLGGLLLGAAMSALQALLPPLPVFLAARTLEGLSHLVLVVAAPTLIAETATLRWRPGAMTLWSTFFSVAFALTAWLGPALLAAHGLEGLLAAHAGYMALMALVLAPLLPRAAPPAPASAAAPVGPVAQHRALYGDPALSAPAWGWLFYTFTFVSVLTLLPQLTGLSDAAALAGLLPLASILVSLTLGVFLLTRVSAVQLSTLGFALSAIASLALLVTGGAAAAILALFLCLGLVQAAGFAAVPELAQAPADRAMANGAIAQMGNLGNLTGTPILLLLLGWSGAPAATTALVACYLAGLGAHLLLARRRARRQEASASRAT